MNKAVLAGLALVLLSACGGGVAGSPSLAVLNGQLLGTWGGNNAVLMALDTTAHVHIGCTAGDTKQAIVTDDQGRFDVPGRYNITLYPVARGPDHPARFTGSTDREMVALPVTLTATTVPLGPVQPELRDGPRMGPCPICRKPAR